MYRLDEGMYVLFHIFKIVIMKPYSQATRISIFDASMPNNNRHNIYGNRCVKMPELYIHTKRPIRIDYDH